MIRAARDIWLGEPTGTYHAIQLDRAYRVHRQYYKEVAAADEALHAYAVAQRPAGR